MNTFWQDLRYGIRLLMKSPGFTVIATLTLAFGIGANTALFSVVNGVLLNPLPYRNPEQLVSLYARQAHFNTASISYPNFRDWQHENRSFSSMAAFRADNSNLTGVGQPERVRVNMISATFFPVLGVQPALGRNFTEQEDQLGAAPVALISEGLWKRKFASSPDVVGQSIDLDATSYTVVGIIPASALRTQALKTCKVRAHETVCVDAPAYAQGAANWECKTSSSKTPSNFTPTWETLASQSKVSPQLRSHAIVRWAVA